MRKWMKKPMRKKPIKYIHINVTMEEMLYSHYYREGLKENSRKFHERLK